MCDVFISYARSTQSDAARVEQALRELGYEVWRDDALLPNQAYAQVIEERLAAAKAVLVLWSADAARSQWVRSEADKGRGAAKLVQISVDGTPPPMPFEQVQCVDLRGWTGTDSSEWPKVVASIRGLVLRQDAASSEVGRLVPPPARPHSICVLPFSNMSGDIEQVYFSDGISEDIITDLAKVSALSVVARHTAFTFKDRAVDVREIARRLDVAHVLEGSVRKAGNRVRISAQLIEGASGRHMWAERWDRELTDIFALQDEIAGAIVRVLKVKLLPGEKRAIERRGTVNADAYDLYLMARAELIGGNNGDPAREETIVSLCRRATAIDPGYAAAWAAMARAQMELRFTFGRDDDDGGSAAERALKLDPDLAEARAVKARHLAEHGREADASREIEAALHLDPDCHEAQMTAARLAFRARRMAEAIDHYESATALAETDFAAPAMLITCYTALGDPEGARRAAGMTVDRAEAILARDPGNGSAMGYAVGALAVLGEADRARTWIARALAIDPHNMAMRYNLACALSAHLRDTDGALSLLGPYLEQATVSWLNNAKTDPDLDFLRGEDRFGAMVAKAEQRLAGARSKNSLRGRPD